VVRILRTSIRTSPRDPRDPRSLLARGVFRSADTPRGPPPARHAGRAAIPAVAPNARCLAVRAASIASASGPASRTGHAGASAVLTADGAAVAISRSPPSGCPPPSESAPRSRPDTVRACALFWSSCWWLLSIAAAATPQPVFPAIRKPAPDRDPAPVIKSVRRIAPTARACAAAAPGAREAEPVLQKAARPERAV